MPWPQAVLVSLLVTLTAFRVRALTAGGAAAALPVGALVLAGLSWQGGAVLLAFFLPGSALPRLWPAEAGAGDAKGDRRDAWQVLANGAAPALAALLLPPERALAACAAGFAAAAADTWATTTGAHSASLPRHLLSGARVPAGTSGAVTLMGSTGAILGAGVVGAAAWPGLGAGQVAAVVLIGWGGMLLDSLLGAAAQSRYRCVTCDVSTERRVHRCGTRSELIGGVRWLDNDGVNAIATIVATISGWLAG